MKHISALEDDSRRRASHSLPSSRYDGGQHRLPSLVEAVPEIRRTNPTQDNIADRPRQLRHSPKGPGEFPTVRSLASSPPKANAARPLPAMEPSRLPEQPGGGRQRYNAYDIRPEVQLPILPGPPTRNSDSSLSSGFSDRRTSLASVTTSTTYPGTRRGSPTLTSLSRAPTPEHLGYPSGDASDPRSIPSVYRSHGQSAYGHERVPLPGGLRESIESYPSSTQRQNLAALEHPYHPVYGAGAPRNLSFADRQPVDPLFLRENGHHHCAVDYQSVEVDQQRHKRRRGNLPKAVTDTLRAWFQEHVANPYPTEDEKQMLMDRTGLTISQISNWFINARRRNLPQMTKQAQAESELTRGQTGSSRASPPQSSRFKRER